MVAITTLFCCVHKHTFHDSRRTRSPGTPAVINTFEGSGVVDVANFILQQAILRELPGLRNSYATVLTANKNSDLAGTYEGEEDEWLRDNYVRGDVNLIMKTVELYE